MPEHDSPPSFLKPEAEQFLRSEFEAQREMRGNLNNLVAAETNIFVAIVAATFLGLSFLGQAIIRDSAIIDRPVLYLAAIGVLVVDYLLGWSTFRRVVSSRITVVRYARTMNRARRYYVDRYPDLADYVSPDIRDDRPPMGSVGSSRPLLDVLSGNTGLIAILASACAGALAGVILAAVLGAGVDVLPEIDRGWRGAAPIGAVVLLAFVGSMAAFERHATRSFEAAEARWEAKFGVPRQPGR
jgi:hypothetical protein